MSGTAQSVHNDAPRGSVTRQMAIELNKLVTDLETLRAKYHALLAKLDADAGVTDADYVSLEDVAAASLLAAQVKDQNGTVITA